MQIVTMVFSITSYNHCPLSLLGRYSSKRHSKKGKLLQLQFFNNVVHSNFWLLKETAIWNY